MQRFTIGANEAGQRLDKFLHKYLREAPDSFLYKMLRKKNITLNGRKADGKELLKQGDQVCFFLAPETMFKFGVSFLPPEASGTSGGHSETSAKNSPGFSTQEYRCAFRQLSGIRVLYQDKQLLLADKPAGVLSQKAGKDDLSLNEWLIGYLLEKGILEEESLAAFRPSVCNRLDRNTSGLVICGVSLQGSRRMSEMLRDRSLRKIYRLFVNGQVRQKERLEGILVKDRLRNQVTVQQAAASEGALVVTDYEPLRVFRHPLLGWISYLEAELITGRTHQIRAQLASAGYPLLGDPKYGDPVCNRLCAKLGIHRQLLHAYRLEFPEMQEPFAALSGRQMIAKEPEIFQTLLSDSPK